VLALVALGAVVFILIGRVRGGADPSDAVGSVMSAPPLRAADWVFDRADAPARTLVHDKNGNLLATFTDGARTVAITGPRRTFREPRYTRASVTHDQWARLAPQAWHAGAERDPWFRDWFTRELTDRSPDALAMAFQYVDGAPDLVDAHGVRYAGDAQFGPHSSSDPDGRAENNDFYDYLGITYSFPDGTTVKPQKDRYGDIDCSGYIRLVYGYRLGYPLRKTNTPGAGLPRRVFAMSRYGPGVEVIKSDGVQALDYAALQPGDLLFFNVDPSDGRAADHSGIFLGVDESGHYRFISSRTLANGPTMGDSKYAAILDGDGHFAVALTNARRL
jgi:cell wall-associated NlpC family hydrolase